MVRVHPGSPFFDEAKAVNTVSHEVDIKTSEKVLKLQYDGSVGWLIFWVIIFFPVALVLMMTAGKFTSEGKTHFIRYSGSRGWLAFWMVVCFPVAFLLMFLNGISLVTQSNA